MEQNILGVTKENFLEKLQQVYSLSSIGNMYWDEFNSEEGNKIKELEEWDVNTDCDEILNKLGFGKIKLVNTIYENTENVIETFYAEKFDLYYNMQSYHDSYGNDADYRYKPRVVKPVQRMVTFFE